jgi:hypothetical protein
MATVGEGEVATGDCALPQESRMAHTVIASARIVKERSQRRRRTTARSAHARERAARRADRVIIGTGGSILAESPRPVKHARRAVLSCPRNVRPSIGEPTLVKPWARVLFLAAAASLGATDMTTPRAHADPPAPILVELFTSEGCSSCPPADEVLARLARDQPEPGVRIVTLSEHVDYWDRLGWRDPFSSATFTARQRGYSLNVSHGRVYTPQAVIDGSLDALGSDERRVRAAVQLAAARPHGTIEASPLGTTALSVVARGMPRPDGAHLFVAWVQDHATSVVTTGENAGRELPHVSVVRALEDAGPIQGGAPVRVTLAPPPSAPHLVLFVQTVDGPIQAVADLGAR